MLIHKPVVLVFTDWFIPGYKAGGPIASCLNFVHLMKDSFDLYVFTSDTDLGETKPYENILPDTWIHPGDNSCRVYYAAKKKLGAAQIKKIADEVRPDFIYLNHMFSPWFVIYPLWLKWKGVIKSKIIVCPRGALYQSALDIKRYKKAPFLAVFRWMGIHKLVRFHATSTREQQAVLHYFPGSEVVVADDLPATRQLAFQSVVKEPGVLKCIFIARIHPIKNLLFLLEVLSQVKQEVLLTIVGPVEDEVYWEACRSYLSSLPPNIRVNYLGAMPSNELPAVLQQQHISILPTKGENFGHSIFESFLAGRPVLISDQTPWLQLDKLHAGWDLPLDRPQAFVKAIETAAAWDQDNFIKWGEGAWQYARDFIDNRGLKQQYLQLFS